MIENEIVDEDDEDDEDDGRYCWIPFPDLQKIQSELNKIYSLMCDQLCKEIIQEGELK